MLKVRSFSILRRAHQAAVEIQRDISGGPDTLREYWPTCLEYEIHRASLAARERVFYIWRFAASRRVDLTRRMDRGRPPRLPLTTRDVARPSIMALVAGFPDARVGDNERGNASVSAHTEIEDRYYFDFTVCTPIRGWEQWDTSQDAYYFGVWVHRERRQILTFAEGDLYVVEASDEAAFAAELAHAEHVYGAPPPWATVIHEDGSATLLVAERLSAEELRAAQDKVADEVISEILAEASLPGVLDHEHVWNEVGDGCWDCLLDLNKAGIPVYCVPDLKTDVSATFPREALVGLVLEVRRVGDEKRGYLRDLQPLTVPKDGVP